MSISNETWKALECVKNGGNVRDITSKFNLNNTNIYSLLFGQVELEIKRIPISLDWSVFTDEFKWAFADGNDFYVCTEEPKLDSYSWKDGGTYINLQYIKSAKRGTVAWDKSLIMRPE